MTGSSVSVMVPPGGAIGILGGGQLGRMTALAAARLGYRCVILTPEENSPASLVSDRTIVAAYDDPAALAELAAAVDVVTLEFENIPVSALRLLESRIPLRPGPRALEVGQDRVNEKTFFGDFAETAPWRPVRDLASLQAAIAAIGVPAILKTARLGYDGKGQVKITSAEQAAEAWATLRCPDTAADQPAPAILEGFVAFQREISVIVARREDGQTAVWPVAGNVHSNHILDTTTVPAGIPAGVAAEAQRIAITAAERLGLIGLLAVEMFVADHHVIVNEMAPRPHNSGHWTMDAAVTDQFEQLVRAVCGLPLGSPDLRCPVVMKNLLGDDVAEWQALLQDPTAKLHLYGKAEAREGRKMGHVNYLKP